MNDSSIGWNHAKVIKGALAPSEKLITLLVALEFESGIDRERICGAVRVNLHRMIDNEVSRLQRIDAGGVTAELANRIAHRSEIGYYRYAGKILQQYARGHE